MFGQQQSPDVVLPEAGADTEQMRLPKDRESKCRVYSATLTNAGLGEGDTRRAKKRNTSSPARLADICEQQEGIEERRERRGD